jgi:hypothetical protein
MTIDLKLKSVLMLVAALCGGLISQMASAQSAVDLFNINAVSISSQAVDGQINLSFTTGNSAGGYILDSFTLMLGANPNAAGLITYANLDLTYGDILNDFNWESVNHTVSASEGDDVFMPDSIGTDTSFLAPNTTYEIVFFWLGGNPLNISSTDALPTSTDDWSYGGSTFPYDTSDVFNGNPVFAIDATPVTAVPEPNVLTLAGLACLAGCWRWRTKYFVTHA